MSVVPPVKIKEFIEGPIISILDSGEVSERVLFCDRVGGTCNLQKYNPLHKI